MFAKKLQNGLEKLRVQRVNKKIGGRKVKNNGIEVSNFAASLYKVTMFKGFFKIEQSVGALGELLIKICL